MDLACQGLLALPAIKELAGMQLVVGMEEPCYMVAQVGFPKDMEAGGIGAHL